VLNNLKLISVVVIGFLASNTVHSAQPDAGSLLQQQKQQEQRLKTPLVLPPVEEQQEPSGSVDEQAQSVQVKGFKFAGNITAFTSEQLSAQLQDVIGKSLTLNELKALAERITNFYRDNGYFLAKAFLPPQDVTEGIINIEIQEGVLDSSSNGLQLRGEVKRSNIDFVRSLFNNAMTQGEPLQQGRLERAILLINQFPALTSSINLEPGSQQGDTRVVMDLVEMPLMSYSAAFDNGGSRYTGAERLTLSASVNGISGYGDQLSFTANGSDSNNTYLMASYDTALGSQGWRGGLSLSRLDYKLGKELASLSALGYAQDVNLHVSYPIILEQYEQLSFNTSIAAKDLEDKAAGSVTKQRDVTVGSVGINWQKNDNLGGGGLTQAGATVAFGDIDLSSVPAALTADQAGPRTHGHYEKATFAVSRLQRITGDLNLLVALNGQVAGKNLDSSEEIQMGGPSGVRAYPVGEGSGDEGVKLTIEGRYMVKRSTVLGDVQASLFIDHARVRQHHDAGNLALTTPNHYELSGWGIGLTASNPGKSEISLSWAHKIDDNPLRDLATGNDADGTRDDYRFWLTASFNF